MTAIFVWLWGVVFFFFILFCFVFLNFSSLGRVTFLAQGLMLPLYSLFEKLKAWVSQQEKFLLTQK